MKAWIRYVAMLLLPLLALTATGCDKLTHTSRSAQSVTMKAFEDTKSSWADFFTYHPPVSPPYPQTRYCYSTQSDIVCYDSEQPMLTSKLIGYQDGDKISWIQPGGGSLGASGGEPVALRPAPPALMRTARQEAYDVQPGVSTAQSKDKFELTRQPTVSTIPRTNGEISVNNLQNQNSTRR